MESSNGKKQPTDTYEIGYAKPPLHTRWKKGESGNRNGRPKQSKSLIEFVEKIAREKVKVREGDDVKEITRTEALVRILFQKVMNGDQKAITSFLSLMREAGLASDPSDEPQSGLIAVPLRSETAKEWEERHRDIRAPLDYWNEQNAATKVREKGTDRPDDKEG